MLMRVRCPSAVLLFAVLAAPVAAPDKLVLRDGRVIMQCKVEQHEQDIFAVFPHGRIKLRPGQVKEILIDMDETFEPRDDFEQEQFE
jgi:hypothetical protein